MDEPFLIPVTYQNKEYEFSTTLLATAYTYKFLVVVNEVEFSFERDDEGNFRAIATSPDVAGSTRVNGHLLQAIASKLEEILS